MTLAFGSAPPNAHIAQQFRAWGVVGHHGIDFGLPSGTGVRAVGAGRVIHAGPLDDFGISIIIRHVWGESLYAHLSRIDVRLNGKVLRGETVGLSGSSGAAFGPHLHFGIRLKGAHMHNGFLGFIDPRHYFQRNYHP